MTNVRTTFPVASR